MGEALATCAPTTQGSGAHCTRSRKESGLGLVTAVGAWVLGWLTVTGSFFPHHDNFAKKVGPRAGTEEATITDH